MAWVVTSCVRLGAFGVASRLQRRPHYVQLDGLQCGSLCRAMFVEVFFGLCGASVVAVGVGNQAWMTPALIVYPCEARTRDPGAESGGLSSGQVLERMVYTSVPKPKLFATAFGAEASGFVRPDPAVYKCFLPRAHERNCWKKWTKINRHYAEVDQYGPVVARANLNPSHAHSLRFGESQSCSVLARCPLGAAVILPLSTCRPASGTALPTIRHRLGGSLSGCRWAGRRNLVDVVPPCRNCLRWMCEHVFASRVFDLRSGHRSTFKPEGVSSRLRMFEGWSARSWLQHMLREFSPLLPTWASFHRGSLDAPAGPIQARGDGRTRVCPIPMPNRRAARCESASSGMASGEHWSHRRDGSGCDSPEPPVLGE